MSDIEKKQTGSPNSASINRYEIEFSGTAKEYFKIWIVNILLSIITLGVYSAWAKARTQRYFYGNTSIGGHSFDYHADPIAILKARIILVVCFLVLALFAQIMPQTGPVAQIYGATIILFFVLGLPAIINMGLRFNARVTSFGNVRFNFKPNYLRALLSFNLLPIAFVTIAYFTASLSIEHRSIIIPFIGIALALLILPFTTMIIQRYYYNSHGLGRSGFNAKPRAQDLYKPLLVTIIILVPGLILFALVGLRFLDLFANPTNRFNRYDAILLAGSLYIVSYINLGLLAIAQLYYRASTTKIAVNALGLGNQFTFNSTLSAGRYAWMAVNNVIATICTLGLLIPWGKIRLYRYAADHITLEAQGELDQFIDDTHKESGVISSEYMEHEGIEFGL